MQELKTFECLYLFFFYEGLKMQYKKHVLFEVKFLYKIIGIFKKETRLKKMPKAFSMGILLKESLGYLCWDMCYLKNGHENVKIWLNLALKEELCQTRTAGVVDVVYANIVT